MGTVYGMECCLKYMGERRVPVRPSAEGTIAAAAATSSGRDLHNLYAFCLYGDQPFMATSQPHCSTVQHLSCANGDSSYLLTYSMEQSLS
jgi:hypothetical protein